jgi:N-acetylmuramoyl-L-alanine amidase
MTIPNTPDINPRPPSLLSRTSRSLATITSVAILVASLFTLWTPTSLISNTITERIDSVFRPNLRTMEAPVDTPTPRPVPPIGIVAGHLGNSNDSGAVCTDGLKEVDINAKIATLVRQNLVDKGYVVDLLEEFDPRLMQYRGLVLVIISMMKQRASRWLQLAPA